MFPVYKPRVIFLRYSACHDAVVELCKLCLTFYIHKCSLLLFSLLSSSPIFTLLKTSWSRLSRVTGSLQSLYSVTFWCRSFSGGSVRIRDWQTLTDALSPQQVQTPRLLGKTNLEAVLDWLSLGKLPLNMQIRLKKRETHTECDDEKFGYIV